MPQIIPQVREESGTQTAKNSVCRAQLWPPPKTQDVSDIGLANALSNLVALARKTGRYKENREKRKEHFKTKLKNTTKIKLMLFHENTLIWASPIYFLISLFGCGPKGGGVRARWGRSVDLKIDRGGSPRGV